MDRRIHPGFHSFIYQSPDYSYFHTFTPFLRSFEENE